MTGEYKNMVKGILAIAAVMVLAVAALSQMAYYAGAGTAAFNLSLLFVTAQTLVIMGAYVLWYRRTGMAAADMMNIADKRRMAFRCKNKYIHLYQHFNDKCNKKYVVCKLFLVFCLFFSNKNEFFARIPVFCNAVMTRKAL